MSFSFVGPHSSMTSVAYSPSAGRTVFCAWVLCVYVCDAPLIEQISPVNSYSHNAPCLLLASKSLIHRLQTLCPEYAKGHNRGYLEKKKSIQY